MLKKSKRFYKTRKSMILSVTYKSVDVLNHVIGFIEERYIVIFDEFHNISQNDIYPDKGTKTPINTLLNNPNAPILFMSATPRIFDLEDEYLNEKMFGKIEYSYGMGDAIRNKYICDYDIYVPDVHVDNSQTTTYIHKEIKISKLIKSLSPKIHFLVKGCLETGSKKCIAYFKSQEDAKNFNDSMLKLNEYYCLNLMVDIIISDATQKSRRGKLNNFTEHKGLAILCSVKILDECIDIPACDSIYIDSPGNSKIRNIQRISRANRLDKNNPHKKSRIFIWADEYNDTVSMIKHLKEFDDDFKPEKIKIINSNVDRGNVVNVQNTRKADSYVELYGLIVGIKKVNTWENNLEKLETYIQENNKLPSKHNTDPEIKKLGEWLTNQRKNYNKKSNIMKNTEIRIKWEEFIQDHEDLFLSNEEIWQNNLEKLETYIQENNKLPTDRNKDPEIRALGVWLANQKRNYNKKSEIMKNNEIRIKWEEFIQDHEDLFLSNEEIWQNNLEKLETYIQENNKLPSKHNTDPEIKKLGEWLSHQRMNYCKKSNIMKNTEIRIKWEEFIQDHEDLFLSNEEIWQNNLEKLETYIHKHNKLPSMRDTDPEIKKLGEWLTNQRKNYNKKSNVMKNNEIKIKWEEFIQDHEDLFLSNEEIWQNNLEKLETYIQENNKLPAGSNKDPEIKKLGGWLSHQKRNYNKKSNIMKNNEIRIKWEELTQNYEDLF